jgi:two-component system, chemotaxis family, sensor kinase CheA
VMDGEKLERMVVVLTDVTTEVERQSALAVQHEFSVLVDQFVRDRRAFHDFWNEACALVQRIVEPEQERNESLRRDVHTLKGNARFFGLTRLSSLCHALEDAMQERGENVLNQKERDSLSAAWESLRVRIEPLMHGATSFVEISREEYQRLVDAIAKRRPLSELDALVRGLRHEPTLRRLTRAKEVIQDAARKLHKSPLNVEVVHNDLRLSPGPLAPFWSVLPHILTNAVDHGIEPDEERRELGKSLPANMWLTTALAGSEFIVEVKDDGRGIDWERVRDIAKTRGFSHRTQEELEQTLFSDGFSLKERVSEVSGRGVGLAAVRSVVTALSGSCELRSSKGQGVTWRFRFPAQNLIEEGHEPARPAEPRIGEAQA